MVTLHENSNSNTNISPFHPGEKIVQTRMGVSNNEIELLGQRVIRSYMPDQHREFYRNQTFLVAAARDAKGRMWSTLLVAGADHPKNATGEIIANTTTNKKLLTFVASPTPTTLHIRPSFIPADALRDDLLPGSDLGILGIEFATKRRNRVNGRITKKSVEELNEEGDSEVNVTIEFRVDQSFGNCPQYIKQRRQWWVTEAASHSTEPIVSNELSQSQMETIRAQETLFLASGYRGEGEDPRYGVDASHRGGPKGWIDVRDSKTIYLPDYAGNNHFNTIGNLEMDNRLGVTIPLFETGGMIQLTGRAQVVAKNTASYPDGVRRVILFTIDEVNHVPEGSLPIRWSNDDPRKSERRLQVTHKIKESEDVTSFYLRPVSGYDDDDPEFGSFQPGQHLPIILPVNGTDKQGLLRTYSLSGGTNWGEYRISVKREPKGMGSRFLHDKVNVGDLIKANKPTGDNVLVLPLREKSERPLSLVLLSAGVGLTPILSMLHDFVNRSNGDDSSFLEDKTTKAYWIHGARNSRHHPMRKEVDELSKLAGDDRIKKHIVYSQPLPQDDEYYDSTGHISVALMNRIVPHLTKAVFYMCGPASLMSSIECDLRDVGVEEKRIHWETF